MHRYSCLLLGATAVAVRLLLWLTTGYAADDAFITFRYAENIAAGYGFVYNLGEPVLGTTTPLFTLLLTGFKLLGFSVPTIAVLLSLVAGAITTIVLYLWGRDLGMRAFALLPAIGYIFSPRSLMVDISGMETASFTMLLTLGLHAAVTRRNSLAIISAGLAALARPEGWLLLMVVVVIAAFKRSRRIFMPLVAVALALSAWIFFSWLYFGSPLPNSMVAKTALYHDTATGSFFGGLSFLLGLHNPVGIVTALFWLLGTAILVYQRRAAALLTLFALVYLSVLASGDAMMFHWYGAPVYPIIILIGTYPIARGLRWLTSRFAFKERALQLTAATLLVVIGVALLLNKQSFLKMQTEVLHQVHRSAGEYLAARVRPGEKVMAEDIGYLGYAYRGDLIDRDGLVSPAAIPYNREQRYWSFVDSVAPDWLFFAPSQPTAAGLREAIDSTGMYQLVREFAYDSAVCYWLCKLR